MDFEQLIELISTKKAQNDEGMASYIGQYCVIRSYDAGVFVGKIIAWSAKTRTVDLEDVIRIHSWSGAASLSQLSIEGVKDPENCRFSMAVENQSVENVIERIPCTDAALQNIKGVSTWKK